MPDKNKILDEYQDASGKVSELIRNLALAGFAVIWIFKNPDNASKILDSKLIWALIFLVVCLALDLTHYITRTIIIHSVYKKIEEKNHNEGSYPSYLKKIQWILFIAKITSMIIAYVFIFIFITCKL